MKGKLIGDHNLRQTSYLGFCLEGLRKTTENVRKTDVSTEIRTYCPPPKTELRN
jgi:hypothetical protein